MKIVDRDVRSLLRKPHRDGAADATLATGACDQGNFSVKVIHRIFPNVAVIAGMDGYRCGTGALSPPSTTRWREAVLTVQRPPADPPAEGGALPLPTGGNASRPPLRTGIRQMHTTTTTESLSSCLRLDPNRW